MLELISPPETRNRLNWSRPEKPIWIYSINLSTWHVDLRKAADWLVAVEVFTMFFFSSSNTYYWSVVLFCIYGAMCYAMLLEHLILSCESCLFSRRKKFAFEPSLLITTGDLIVTLLVVLHTFASSVSFQILVFQLVFPRSFSSLGRDVPPFRRSQSSGTYRCRRYGHFLGQPS